MATESRDGKILRLIFGDLWLADDLFGEMMVVGSRWVKREGCFGDCINKRWLLGSSKDEKD